MLFGTGLAFYLGKPLIEPTAPRCPRIEFRMVERCRAGPARRCGSNVLFLIGIALAPVYTGHFRTHALGLLNPQPGAMSRDLLGSRQLDMSVAGNPAAVRPMVGVRLVRRNRAVCVPVRVSSTGS